MDHMSSAARRLVLDDVASREREHICRHSICRVTECIYTDKRMKLCLLIQAFEGPECPSFSKKNWSHAAVHQLATASLPPAPKLRPSLCQCHSSSVGGEVAAILDSLRGKERRKKKLNHQPASSLHVLFNDISVLV